MNDDMYFASPAHHSDLADATVDADTLAEALAGLSRQRKTLPAKLFYDDAGCQLFQRITELPEYYLTRTERALLTRIAPELATILPSRGALVEYGASDEAKARLLSGDGGNGFLASVS